jgi:hypothetical protein
VALDAGSCATESAMAMRVPVDIVLLVDISSSMANIVAGGTLSKWEIARDALSQFLRDPQTAGLNIGLQFFPLGASCALPDYRKLAVPFGELPGAAGPLTTAIQNVRLGSGTPTGPAIIGVIEELRAYLATRPTHRGLVVLVTDGEPTPPCTPVFIDEIAVPVANARQMNPSIPTYVIGVFTAAELGRANDTVGRLATAGGTMPFLLSASADLPKKLSEALNQVRNVGVPCEFIIPRPQQALDYGKVNVHHRRTGGEDDVPYVASAARCDPVRGGWYYDVDPAAGTPTRVVVCPATCNAFKSDAMTRVDLVFGCKTKVIE